MINSEKVVFMLCGHEPTLDPRVRWEAETASKKYRVIILGLHNEWIKSNFEDIEKKRFADIIRLKKSNIKFSIVNFAKFINDKFIFLKTSSKLTKCLIMPFAVALFIFHDSLKILLNLTHGTLLKSSLIRCKDLLKNVGFLREIRVLLGSLLHFAKYENLVQMALRELPKPYLIHANDLDGLIAGVAIKNMFPDVKLVYDAHEFYSESDPNSSAFRKKLFLLLEKQMLNQCDKVITVSAPLAHHMQKLFGLKKVAVIPNAEPLGNYYEDYIISDSKICKLAKNRVKLLFQGNYAAERGLEEIINEWYEVDSSKVCLFLRGPENEHSDKIKQLVKEKGYLNQSIFFIPPVKEDHLISAAREFDIGLIPYKSDIINYKFCCPNKLSQYLQAGIGIASNDLIYVKSILTQYNAGVFYNSEKPGSFSSLINRIANDKKEISRLKSNSLLAAQEFNWEKFENILLELYKK